MLINLSQSREVIAKPLTIITICCVALTFAASFSSSDYLEYVYDYEVSVGSGNTGFKLKAKANLEVLYVEQSTDSGGGGDATTTTNTDSNLVQPNELLVRLRLTDPVYYPGGKEAITGAGQPLVFKNPSLHNPNYDLYARILTLSNGTAQVKELFTHKLDATTYKNIKKSILLNILPTNHHLNPNGANELEEDGQKHKRKQPLYYYNDDHITIQPICTHDNNQDQPELFSPDSISSVHIIAKPKDPSSTRSSTAASRTKTNNIIVDSADGSKRSIQQELNGLTMFQKIDGYQNVTFKSRVFAHAESELTTEFHLSLVKEIDARGHERYDSASSIKDAIKLLPLGNDYIMDSTQLERERKICSSHHCGNSLAKLAQDYRADMHDDSMASIDAAVAFLRILNRLRETKGSSADDIMKVLESARGFGPGFESSLLDVLTAARTKNSIMAVLKYIKLAKQTERNLSVAERFLSTLSVVAKTTAKMHHKRPLKSPYYFTPTPALKRGKQARETQAQMASLEFITKEFLSVIEGTPARKWKSQKLRWSSLLTLATLVNSYNQERDIINAGEDALNQKVNKLLIQELKACKEDEPDCRIVALQAIGNIGYLSDDQFQVLRQQILESGKRESVTATKVLRDLLQNQPKDQQLSEKFFAQLKDLLLRVVYDSTAETTSRVLASEMIVRFLPSSVASEELLRHLPSFGNNELATMIYSRMQSLKPDSMERFHENWYWKSCIINGTSTSFVRTMAETQALNASYGVNVEMNKAKILKESSFDVFLDTAQRTQDIFSLGIFVRGVSGMVGSSDSDAPESDHDESTMAGMTLRLLGGYLRPLVFFSNMGELMGHVWSGTVSEPTSAFNGNLLLIDHDEGYPLISGFVAEQQMRGVLSIDVSGQASVSIWHRNSNSVVKTKAAVTVQASQSVFTSHDDLWLAHLFSFGGNAMIDFIADVNFLHMPVKVCLQVTQPDFMVRYNSRRHDQIATESVRRKITRRQFQISSKSYPLNSENNKMCAAMHEGED